MIKTKTSYICDICHAESEKKEFLHKAYVPAWGDDGEGGMVGCEYPVIEMCKDCQERLRNVVGEHFATVHESCGGIKIYSVKGTNNALHI